MGNRIEYPLSLVIQAIDQATAPLRRVNKRIQEITAPVRRLNNSLRALSDEAGIPRLVQGFKGVGTAVGKVGHEAWALGKRLAMMAAAAGFALYRIVKGAIDAGDKLEEMSQRVGLSVDAYAQLQFAAAQADVEQEAFNGAMDQFNKRLGMAKAGTGPMLAFLQKVSPALAKQVKGSKSTEEAIGLVTKAFEKTTDPGKRAALAAALFGKSGLQMGQFLGQGTKAIEEQRKKFLELSGSQEAFAKGASELDNTIRETEMAFGGLRNAAMAGLFPAFRELSQELTKFLVANREGITKWAKEAGAAIMDWVKGGGLERLGENLKSIAETVGKVVKKIGGLKGVAVVVGAVMAGPLLASLVSLGSALVGLVIPALSTLATVLGAAFLPLTLLGVAIFMLYRQWKNIKLLWQFNVTDRIASAAATITEAWSGVKGFFSGIWDSIVGVFTSAWEAIKPILEKILPVLQFTPVGAAFQVGSAINQYRNGPPIGAAAAVAQPGQQKSEAHVTVDFANLPRGARVTPDSGNTAPLDLALGYSMIGP